jgi:hypothetical protein
LFYNAARGYSSFAKKYGDENIVKELRDFLNGTAISNLMIVFQKTIFHRVAVKVCC